MNRERQINTRRRMDIGAILKERGVERGEGVRLERRVTTQLRFDRFRLRRKCLRKAADRDSRRESVDIGQFGGVMAVDKHQAVGRELAKSKPIERGPVREMG